MKRRDLLAVAGLVAIGAGWQAFGVRRPGLEFRDLGAAPGWRFAALGGVSGASGADLMTIGLSQGPPALGASATVGRGPFPWPCFPTSFVPIAGG